MIATLSLTQAQLSLIVVVCYFGGSFLTLLACLWHDGRHK